jgi:ADP-ribosylglycohydrolase
MGSAITYYRRYTLQSLLSMQAQDDDGQLASQPQRKESIDNTRFEKALESIKQGTYTVDKLKASFELTELQTKSLLLL